MLSQLPAVAELARSPAPLVFPGWLSLICAGSGTGCDCTSSCDAAATVTKLHKPMTQRKRGFTVHLLTTHYLRPVFRLWSTGVFPLTRYCLKMPIFAVASDGPALRPSGNVPVPRCDDAPVHRLPSTDRRRSAALADCREPVHWQD